MSTAAMLHVIRAIKGELLRPPIALSTERVAFIISPAFTRSDAWIRLRYDFMRDHDGRCQCCGRRATAGMKVNVDHIRPRRTHPHLALNYANLQVLCATCNRGKGNRDTTDWRFRGPADPANEKPASIPIPTCPACRAPMKSRQGQHGAFWGCSTFPTCRATRPGEKCAHQSQRRGRGAPPR